MKGPSFSEGVLLALVASLLGSISYTVLPELFDLHWTRHALITGLSLGYVLYLLRRSEEHTGRLVTLGSWLLLTGISWFVIDGTLPYLAMHLGIVWLVRALYHQPGPLAAILDLVLSLIAGMAGLWALLHTGSLFLGIWTLFLVQALFVAIPAIDGRRQERERFDARADHFQTAYRSAETALRKLSTKH